MSLSSSTFVYAAALVAVAACIAGVLVWRRKVKARAQTASPEPPPSGSTAPGAALQARRSVDAVFHEANHRLKLSPRMKGASVASLPVFLIVGPQGAGKTSAMAHSGLDPELLAGQVYQGTEIAPTTMLNIWLARQQAIFVEIPAALSTDANVLKAILSHLAPRGLRQALRKERPPRAILLCLSQAPVAAAATPDEIAALARPWNECVSLAASALGVQLAVYALFTKMDGVTGFPEFVSNLAARETVQAVGATIRPFNPEAGRAYAEDASRGLDQHFSEIAYALCDGRTPLLARERDIVRLALEYQFPREFQKLQKNLVQFLVAVGRPSQLQVSAFLRGFYFCGVRKVAAESAGKQSSVAQAAPSMSHLAATTVLNPERIRAQMAAARAAESSEAGPQIAEWLFVRSVFESVLLCDRTAHGVASASVRTDRVRAVAFGVLGVLSLFAATSLTVSYSRNRLLEKHLASAAETPDPAKRLEEMRPYLERLAGYSRNTPLYMEFGLYQGSSLLPPAKRVYCSAMRPQVLQPAFDQMAAELTAVPNPRSGIDPARALDTLRAYMMMTTHPQYADGTFLSEKLLDVWKSLPAATAPPEDVQLLPAQLRLYGDLLAVPGAPDASDACLFSPNLGLIPAAQDYLLRTLHDRYPQLLALAGRGIGDINYDRQYPNDAVHDPQTLSAAFTKQGWAAMQGVLASLPESLKADAWVLNETKEYSPAELSAMAADYRTKYAADFKNKWKAYLDSAVVTSYKSWDDAAAKLDEMSGQHSFLLNLIGLASEHAGAVAATSADFQPARAVAPATDSFQLAADYRKSLDAIKNRLASAAHPPSDQDVQAVRTALTEAMDTTDRLAGTFQGDAGPEVKRILRLPIDRVKEVIETSGGETVTATGKSLCSYMGLYPFSGDQLRKHATLDEVRGAFDPQSGAAAQLSGLLRDSLDCIGGLCRPKPSPKFAVQPRFLDFFAHVNSWSRLLSTGGQLGMIRLSLKAKPSHKLKTLTLTVDSQTLTLQAGGEAGSMNWDLSHSSRLRLDGVFTGGDAPELTNATGPWALFDWIFDSEANSGGSAGFHWIPRSGVSRPQVFSNGDTKEYEIEIQADGNALDRRSLAVGTCVLPLGK